MTNRHKNLFLAIEKEDPEEVRACLSGGANVNERDHRPNVGGGNTPLHNAATLGNVAIVQLLMEAGAEINSQCQLGWTPLIRACNAGHLQVAEMLLAAGADPNIRNDEGYTAFDRIPGKMTEFFRRLKNWG